MIPAPVPNLSHRCPVASRSAQNVRMPTASSASQVSASTHPTAPQYGPRGTVSRSATTCSADDLGALTLIRGKVADSTSGHRKPGRSSPETVVTRCASPGCSSGAHRASTLTVPRRQTVWSVSSAYSRRIEREASLQLNLRARASPGGCISQTASQYNQDRATLALITRVVCQQSTGGATPRRYPEPPVLPLRPQRPLATTSLVVRDEEARTPRKHGNGKSPTPAEHQTDRMRRARSATPNVD